MMTAQQEQSRTVTQQLETMAIQQALCTQELTRAVNAVQTSVSQVTDTVQRTHFKERKRPTRATTEASEAEASQGPMASQGPIETRIYTDEETAAAVADDQDSRHL